MRTLSLPVMILPHDPQQMITELSPYTTAVSFAMLKKLTETIIFPAFFLTIVVVQNVGNVEPLGARPFFGFVFPVLFQIVCDLLYT
jgi:hypothetical protein